MSQISPGLSQYIPAVEAQGMTDLQKASVTAFFTVVTGVLVYLIKTIIDEYWISHLREYKKLKADISFNLVKFANVYMNADKVPNKRADEGGVVFRDLASKVAAFIETRPRICIGVPRIDSLKRAMSNLIGLSNGMYAIAGDPYITIRANEKKEKEIRKELKLVEVE